MSINSKYKRKIVVFPFYCAEISLQHIKLPVDIVYCILQYLRGCVYIGDRRIRQADVDDACNLLSTIGYTNIHVILGFHMTTTYINRDLYNMVYVNMPDNIKPLYNSILFIPLLRSLAFVRYKQALNMMACYGVAPMSCHDAMCNDSCDDLSIIRQCASMIGNEEIQRYIDYLYTLLNKYEVESLNI